MSSYIILYVYSEGCEVLSELFNPIDIDVLRCAIQHYREDGYECRTEYHGVEATA